MSRDCTDLGCTAIVCQNDDHAAGALRAFAKAGVRVPGDVGVVGFDGTIFGEMISPRLTSVAVRSRGSGRPRPKWSYDRPRVRRRR